MPCAAPHRISAAVAVPEGVACVHVNMFLCVFLTGTATTKVDSPVVVLFCFVLFSSPGDPGEHRIELREERQEERR